MIQMITSNLKGKSEQMKWKREIVNFYLDTERFEISRTENEENGLAESETRTRYWMHER